MTASSAPPPDPLAREIAVLARASYPLLVLATREEGRAVALVRAAAGGLSRPLWLWSASRGLAPIAAAEGDPSTTDPRAAIDAIRDVEEPAIFVFLDLHPHWSRFDVVRAMRDRLAEVGARGQTLVVVSPEVVLPPELDKDATILDVPLPSGPQLRTTLEGVAASEGCAIAPDEAERAVRSALGLTLDQAARIFRKVLVLGGGLREADLARVVAEKKSVLARTDALEFHELGESLSDVGGLDELKRWLSARSRAFGDEARAFGLPPPKGLLLLGVQGCGKSLSAKAVAELWKFPLLRLDLSLVFSTSAGSPEATIREATKVAESLAPVVLWIDEIEKGFHQVDGSESSARVFGSFVTWLAEKSAEVFVVATANNVAELPPELTRRGRFDEVFFVDLPSVHERLEILRIHLRRRGRDPDAYSKLDSVVQLTEHFSGAEIEQVVVSGLYRAFSAQRDLTGEDLELAAKQTVPLYATYEERIKALRDWARRRARPASRDSSVLDLFSAS